MEIYGRFPIKGDYSALDKEFEKWWRIINSIGIGGFLLFLACLGTGEHKYYCAILSLSLYFWALIIAQTHFPKIVKDLKKSKHKTSRKFANSIVQEYVPVIIKPHLFLPFWLGTTTLIILAVYPHLIRTPSLYVPT